MYSPANAATIPVKDGVIRVMLVDDSAVIRGLFSRALEADPEIEIVASVGDGQMALNAIKRNVVDVAVVDIEMPVMDGLTALPLLLAAKPDLIVIIASSLTRQNAEISFRALKAGAKDYIPKPSTREISSRENFARELIGKIKALAGSARAPRAAPPRTIRLGQAGPHIICPATPEFSRPALTKTISLRAPSCEPVRIIAIAASTGGPQALFSILANLSPSIVQPIVVTQHMPATFTTILAEHLTRISGRPCHEAVDQQRIENNHIYIAPGDYHLLASKDNGLCHLRLSQSPPENFCRPSADTMLRSLAPIYGGSLLTLVLTGMGSDGLVGAGQVIEHGGTVIAQDEATSIVWGMPRAVAYAGLCSAILPLGEFAGYLFRTAIRPAA